jgi:hypothetical protein
MAKGIACFSGTNLKLGKPGEEKALEQVFDERIEGKDVSEHGSIGVDIALEYHKQLFGELEKFKSTVDTKYTPKKYTPIDKTEAIKKIKERYDGEINTEKEKVVSVSKENALSPEENKEWNNLSMAEKLSLAQKNLPEISGLSNVDLIREDDKNAKELLGKLREQATENKIGKFEEKARLFAEKIMKTELPSWAKADVPEGTELSGMGFDQLKKLIADATIKVGQLLDAGVKFTEAVKEAVKDIVSYLGEDKREAIENGFAEDYIKNVGGIPKEQIKITADQAEKLDAQTKKEKSQSDAYEEAGEFEFGKMPFEPTDNPIINHKLKTNGVQQAFGTELTQQEIWNDMPSEDRYDVQIKMLDDGNEMIGLAKMMFGGTDIKVYGPELFRFIQSMAGTTDNKKVILMATFIGELRNELDRSQKGDVRPLFNAVNLYYRNYMNVTAKNLAAGRILRLFTDKYMAGVFGDVILENNQVEEKKGIENAIADTDIKDEDAQSFQDERLKGKTAEQAEKESKAAKSEAAGKRAESAKRKAVNKKQYEDLYKKKEADVKAKHGDKKSLLDDIIKKINDLNCP